MSFEEKTSLIDSLNLAHAATQETVQGMELEEPIYPDSGWRIRDIIGHIATWDRQVAASLRAYRVGEEYAIPDLDEDAFNEQEVLRQQDLTSQQLVEEWEQAHLDFRQAIEEIPLDLFPGDMLYPWGDERGTIAYLVKTMTDHGLEHRDEIVKAVQSR